MNTIKINNLEIEVEGYNKSTVFSGDQIMTNASCSTHLTDVSPIYALAEETITSISIYHDQELIYNLEDIEARIESINEYLDIDRMGINISFTFDNMQQDVI